MSTNKELQPNTIAIILARGGSKGIPKKNIIDLGGKPLIGWSIDAAKNAKSIQRIVVSSDDKEILEIAAAYGAEIVVRPMELAQDTSRSEPAMTHALRALRIDEEDLYNHYTVLLQPTSPLRTSVHIDTAFHLLREEGGDALVSVREVDNKYLKAYIKNEDGYMMAAAHNREFPNTARQLLPNLYMPNGALYMVLTEYFLQTGRLMGHKTLPFVMDEQVSVDVDTMTDLEYVRHLIR